MKPVYTNHFFVSRNPVNSEIIIELKHSYLEHNIVVDGQQGRIEPVNKVEDVLSLCLGLTDAIALRDALDRVIGDVYVPNK